MLCCKSTFQDSPEKSERIEVVSEVSKLVQNDVLIERFVDLPDLLARVENDRELLAELFAMFQEEFPALSGRFTRCDEYRRSTSDSDAAHTLKGMLANMSMKHGASLAANIEAAARIGDMQAIKVTLAAFDSEIVALSKAIDDFVAGN